MLLSVVCLMYISIEFVWCVNECVRFFKLCCGHEHLAPMTYPGQYTRWPSLSSLTEERARELCRMHGAGSSVSHQSSGVSRDRAAAASQPTSRQRAPATCHGERHAIATTRVVLYPTIKQWNGCPSDKRQLVGVSYMLLEGRRVGAAAGALGGRPSSPSLGRPPARASVAGLGTRTGPGTGTDAGTGTHRGSSVHCFLSSLSLYLTYIRLL